MPMPGDGVLLHAHLVSAEAVDHVLAEQMDDRRLVDRQVELVDRGDVVLARRGRCGRGRAGSLRGRLVRSSVRPKMPSGAG